VYNFVETVHLLLRAENNKGGMKKTNKGNNIQKLVPSVVIGSSNSNEECNIYLKWYGMKTPRDKKKIFLFPIHCDLQEKYWEAPPDQHRVAMVCQIRDLLPNIAHDVMYQLEGSNVDNWIAFLVCVALLRKQKILCLPGLIVPVTTDLKDEDSVILIRYYDKRVLEEEAEKAFKVN